MKINIGEYLITSDNLQFIVSKKSIVQESRLTKAENVGKEKETAVGYCTKFEDALRFIPQHVLKTNDDIVIIMDKLTQIKADIKAITEYPVIEIKAEKQKRRIQKMNKVKEKILKCTTQKELDALRIEVAQDIEHFAENQQAFTGKKNSLKRQGKYHYSDMKL